MTSLDMKPGNLFKTKDGTVYVITSQEQCHMEVDEDGVKWLFEGVKRRLQILTAEQVKILEKSGNKKWVFTQNHLTQDNETRYHLTQEE
jgi:hypothetical protein